MLHSNLQIHSYTKNMFTTMFTVDVQCDAHRVETGKIATMRRSNIHNVLYISSSDDRV